MDLGDAFDEMGLDARKPVCGFCKQQRRRPACAFVQSDQRLYYSLITYWKVSYVDLL